MVRIPISLDPADLLRPCPVLASAVLAQAVLAWAVLGLCQCKAAPDHPRGPHNRNGASCSDHTKGRHQARDSLPTVYLHLAEDSIREWAPRQVGCPLRGCKAPPLGILNIAVHHRVRDKCLCRVSLLSRGHLGLGDQDMECLRQVSTHSSNKGVESRSINDDNRSRPGQDWKEHFRTRPVDCCLYVTTHPLPSRSVVWVCDGPSLWLASMMPIFCSQCRPSFYVCGSDDCLRSVYTLFSALLRYVVGLRTCMPLNEIQACTD